MSAHSLATGAESPSVRLAASRWRLRTGLVAGTVHIALSLAMSTDGVLQVLAAAGLVALFGVLVFGQRHHVRAPQAGDVLLGIGLIPILILLSGLFPGLLRSTSAAMPFAHLGALFAAAIEELVFRGHLILGAERHRALAALLSSVVFGAFHYQYGVSGVLYFTCYAGLLALATLGTRRIAPALVAHVGLTGVGAIVTLVK